MEIEINGFKCYSKTSFQFSGGVTLLKGCSGAGKSTILQAITWCLFGGMRGVDRNRGSRKSKLNVTLRIEVGGKKCEIYRQKRPNLLTFRAGRLEQIDQVAQTQINDIFGSEEMWKLCCYLEQSLTNPLFRGSASEKMFLLNKVAFNESDPTPYIRKIEGLLKEEKIRFQVLQEAFTRECTDFSEFIKTQDINPDDGKSEEAMEVLLQEKRTLESDITCLRERDIRHHQSVAAIQILEEQIKNMEEKLSSFPKEEILPEQLTQLRNTIDLLQSLKYITEEMERMDVGIAALRSEYMKFTDVDVCTVKTLCETQATLDRYHKYLQKAQQCDIEYTTEKIENQKEFLRCLFKIQPALQTHTKVLAMYEQISALPIYDVDESTVKTQEEKIYELKRGSNVLNCPQCGQHLIYKEKSLEACDHAPSTEKELKQANEVLFRLNQHLSSRKQREQLIEQFEKLKTTYTEEIQTITAEELGVLGESSTQQLNASEIDAFKKQLHVLHSIDVVECPKEDIERLRRGVAKQKALDLFETKKREGEKLTERYNQYVEKCKGDDDVEKVPVFQKQLQTLQTQRSLRMDITQSLERATSSKAEHMNRLDYGIVLEVQQKETRLNEVRDIVEKARVTNEAVRRQTSLQTQREFIVEAQEKVYHLERLKGIAVEVECKVLQQTVDSINSTINILAENIFDEPIRVELKLYRRLKTKKTIKPGVNVEIRYKGGVYENPNEISGGEQDRLSLLLTLAMNRLSGSPLIMLDETFSSLDEGIKEHCLRAVRSATSGKTVICVDHSGVEGYYDQVLQIGPE
uniref:Chromosome segregation ATPase n=1 Tax=Pithovirus LCPAC304 TaxID=2506594 RepID=A0A481Z9E6_9VIRU|nr:MAG: chromosome segregation ATPase [Pithovirus LCPAC304]